MQRMIKRMTWKGQKRDQNREDGLGEHDKMLEFTPKNNNTPIETEAIEPKYLS